MSDYKKLSEVESFTVKGHYPPAYKRWNEDEKKMEMLKPQEYFERQDKKGFQKKYTIETNVGKIDISAHQVGQMLEGVLYKGEAKLIDRSFSVKTNGKTGMDIRYYINPIKEDVPAHVTADKTVQEVAQEQKEDIDVSQMPF